jgi:hypothetical protein
MYRLSRSDADGVMLAPACSLRMYQLNGRQSATIKTPERTPRATLDAAECVDEQGYEMNVAIEGLEVWAQS